MKKSSNSIFRIILAMSIFFDMANSFASETRVVRSKTPWASNFETVIPNSIPAPVGLRVGEPVAGSGTIIAGNPNGVNLVTIPANTFTNLSNSTDDILVASIRITAMPTGAVAIKVGFITYGPGFTPFPGAGLIIPTDGNGRPTETIAIDPSIDGPTTVTINFVAVDNNANESLNLGTATVNFVDDNCGNIQGNTGSLKLLSPLPSTITNLMAGDKLLKENAIFTNGSWYDAVITILTENVSGANTGALIVDNTTSTGNLSLSGVNPSQQPYVTYNITFVEAGSATVAVPNGIPVTLANISITIPDLDGAPARDYGDVGGYSTSFSPNSVQTGTALESTGFVSGGPGAGFVYYKPKIIPAASVPVGDPNYHLVMVKNSFSGADFAFGVTATATPVPSITANRLFFHTFQQSCSVIKGNVFHDANGLKDSQVNGTAVDGNDIDAVSVGNQPVYVSLIQGGVVIATTQVTTSGDYTFTNKPNGTYDIVLHTTATGSATHALPSGWIETGEFHGTGPGDDNFVDGILTVIVNGAEVTNANFAIEQLPDSDTKSGALSPAPGTAAIIPLDGSIAGATFLTGKDPEDYNPGGTLSSKMVAITSLPTNGTLYYNGQLISLGADGLNTVSIANPFIITSLNPGLLELHVNGSAYVSTSFKYAYVDLAGMMDPSPATYTLTWTALPVTLIRFSVQKELESAILNWATTTEINSQSFDIERSSEGKLWKSIGSVPAKGESKSLTTYSFQDASPLNGGNLYRLRMIDADGSFTFSRMLSLEFVSSLKGAVYPNPTAGMVRIDLDALAIKDVAAIDLYALDGKAMVAKTNVLRSEIDVTNVPSGTYLVVITMKNGMSKTTKIQVVK